MSQQDLEERNAQLTETSNKLSSTQLALSTTRKDLFTTTKEKEERGFLIEEHVKTEDVLLDKAQQVSCCYCCCCCCVFFVVVVFLLLLCDNLSLPQFPVVAGCSAGLDR